MGETPSSEPRQPIQLSYGQHAPVWRRRKIILGTILTIALLTAGWFAQKPVRDWLELRAYRAEAARWYAAGLSWSEPASKLKYTENLADAPGGKFIRSYSQSGSTTAPTGFRSFGGAFVERLPLFTGEGKPILAASPDQVMLFMHQRTTSAGLTRLIAVGQPGFENTKLGLNISQIGLLRGDYRILQGNYRQIDMSGIAGPGEIRLFAGQADPNDAAKFSIPFEARGKTGFIDGEFVPGQSFAKDPASQKIEQEINSEVKLTIRMTATTLPSAPPTTAPAPK